MPLLEVAGGARCHEHQQRIEGVRCREAYAHCGRNQRRPKHFKGRCDVRVDRCGSMHCELTKREHRNEEPRLRLRLSPCAAGTTIASARVIKIGKHVKDALDLGLEHVRVSAPSHKLTIKPARLVQYGCIDRTPYKSQKGRAQRPTVCRQARPEVLAINEKQGCDRRQPSCLLTHLRRGNQLAHPPVVLR